MNQYDFDERLHFSTTYKGRSFEEIIAGTIPGVVTVAKTDTAVDKTGVDYVATLRRGATINIDLKLRDAGASKYWQHGFEELALEKWSVVPENGRQGVAGWTLDEAKATHYTMHAFAPEDSQRVILLPFQLLRKAFKIHLTEWYRTYQHAQQSSGRWRSECVFVPADIVIEAIAAVMG